MAKVEQSFLSNLFGKSTYADFKEYGKVIVPIGTLVLLILFVISQIVYWEFISRLLYLLTGTSLLFIGYIILLIVLLDFQIETNEEEETNDFLYIKTKEKVQVPKPHKYKLTIVWGIILVIGGCAMVYYTNKYRKQYTLDCEELYIIPGEQKVYHLDYTLCDKIEEADEIISIKGYEISGKGYTLCPSCKACAEEVGDYRWN